MYVAKGEFVFILGNLCDSVPEDSVQPRDCSEVLRKNPESLNGIYTIYPLGQPQSTFCDMETDGGGWTVKSFSFEHENIRWLF